MQGTRFPIFEFSKEKNFVKKFWRSYGFLFFAYCLMMLYICIKSHENILKGLILLLAVPRRLFCFGSLVILDMLCCYLSLFLLHINIKIGKK